MSFLHTGIAWAALASMALPIVIHLLFRRRRRQVEWAAMELLREAVRRTNRRLRFEQWLVLLLRCLAVLAAGLAIAVPLLDGSTAARDAQRLVMVVVDDGPTGGLRVGEETELARMVDEVRGMLASRDARDRIGVVLASKPARMVLAPTADAGAVEQALSRIEPVESPTQLSDALALALSTIDGERASGGAGAADARIVVASAFRRASLADGAAFAAAREGAQRVEIVPLLPAREMPVDVRVSRVEARPAPAGSALLARVVIERDGPSLDASESFVRVGGEGLSTPPGRTVSWEKGQSEATVDFQLLPASLSATARRVGLTASIDDADPLSAGNAAHAAVDVRRELEVGIVGRRTSLDASDLERVASSLWVSRALSPAAGSGMRVRDIDPSSCDARALLGIDVLVLARPDLVSPSSCDAMRAFARAGGVVVVLPPGESLSQSWTTAVLPRLGVQVRLAAEAIEHDPPLRMAEEQPATALLAAIGPEISALVSPVETLRSVAMSGFARGEIILAHADGTPLVIAQVPRDPEDRARDDREATGRDTRGERGLVVVFSAPPELLWCNLPVKPLMVPLFQELARAGAQLAAGRNEVVVGERMSGEPGALMRHADGATVSIGSDGLSDGPVVRSGLWETDAGSVVAANLRGESLSLAVNSVDAVRAFLEPLGEVRMRAPDQVGEADVDAVARPDRWAFALFVAALALLLIEGVLSRLFSHASVRRAQPVEAAVTLVGRRSVVRPASQPREESRAGAAGGAR